MQVRTLSPHSTQTIESYSAGSGSDAQSTNIAEVLWRYRWAVALPAVFGAVVGLLIYLQLPETYRSTTRLMIESDHAAVLDPINGDLVGGVPSLDIVQSQLFSDRVMETTFKSARLRPFQEQFENSVGEFVQESLDSLELEPEVSDLKSAQSVVTLMHFNSENRELCQAAVQSFSDSLQSFYNENYRSSRSDLIRLISTGMERLHPKMLELESRYRTFRRDAPLAWDAQGNAINPFREQQLALVKRRSKIEEELQTKAGEVAALKRIVSQSSKDPLLGLNIIGELLDKRFSLPTSGSRLADLYQGDEKLAITSLDKDLVPLQIERENLASQFGEAHPTVRSLDAQLESRETKMTKLLLEETGRVTELIGESLIDPVPRAKEAISAIVLASEAQVDLLIAQRNAVDEQIKEQRLEASKLSGYEQENASQLREIERTRELLEQLQEEMAKVSIGKDERGTRVIELTSPSVAYKVGPSIIKTVGLGGFLGIMLGAGLALLLEKNANTFRDPDEISEQLGVPVLTHIPFFKGKLKKLGKDQVNPYDRLDPSLAVVHMPASVPAEAIRSCRTSVFFETAGPGCKVIQVTSPLPGDGKSTIAGNLACSIAQSGKRTLVIDCDLRRPQLTDYFDLADQRGLTDVLNGDCDIVDGHYETAVNNLFVMPSGPIPGNPAEALTLPDMEALVETLKTKFDYIVVDTPPLLVVTDPSIVAGLVDGVILALRVRRKSRHNAKESMNILRSVGVRVLGVVINNSDESGASDGYRGYGYYRYARHTSRYYRSSKGNNSRTKSEPLIVSGVASRPARLPSASPVASSVPVGDQADD